MKTIDKIRGAQILAGEKAVIDNLKRKGFNMEKACAICNVPDSLHGTCCGWHNAKTPIDENGIITHPSHPQYGQHWNFMSNAVPVQGVDPNANYFCNYDNESTKKQEPEVGTDEWFKSLTPEQFREYYNHGLSQMSVAELVTHLYNVQKKIKENRVVLETEEQIRKEIDAARLRISNISTLAAGEERIFTHSFGAIHQKCKEADDILKDLSTNIYEYARGY